MAQGTSFKRTNWCVTESKTEKFSFEWTIKNFSFHCRDVGYLLKSSEFSSKADEKTKWFIQAYPNGNTVTNEGYMSLFLHSTLDSITEKVAKFKISIIGQKSTVSRTELRQFTQKSCNWGWNKFIEIVDLRMESKGLLPNDTLTLQCEIELLTTAFNKSGKAPPLNTPQSRLSRDLFIVFENGLLSDITLESQGKKFKVHKIILAARSPVFKAMFTSEMKEKRQRIIHLHDMDSDTLYALLHFIYTGDPPQLMTTTKLARDLLAAADKYDLERLKVICQKDLLLKLTVENVLDLLIVADMHHALQLKTSTLDFIDNHMTAVLNTDNWAFLRREHSHLLTEVLRHRGQYKYE